jgi:hypothetical protein
MIALLPELPVLRSRLRVLFATLIVATGLLLIGAVSAQAKPGDPPADFLMELNATSASFTPIADKPGEYRLVLKGVSTKPRVTELTKAEYSTTMPLKDVLAYWTLYGDKTGQFETNPPRAVLHGLDPGEGTREEVEVRLRDASPNGTTLTFDAEIITSTRVWNILDKKIAEIDETLPPSDPELEPTTLTDVEMFIDMPTRITQPEPEPTSTERTIDSQIKATQTPTPRMLTCNGVRSSRLSRCWNDLPDKWISDNPGPSYNYRPDSDRKFWLFYNIGEVNADRVEWAPALYGTLASWMDYRRDRRGHAIMENSWYGVQSGVTMYATSRCTWFAAKWSPNGRCW